MRKWKIRNFIIFCINDLDIKEFELMNLNLKIKKNGNILTSIFSISFTDRYIQYRSKIRTGKKLSLLYRFNPKTRITNQYSDIPVNQYIDIYFCTSHETALYISWTIVILLFIIFSHLMNNSIMKLYCIIYVWDTYTECQRIYTRVSMSCPFHAT